MSVPSILKLSKYSVLGMNSCRFLALLLTAVPLLAQGSGWRLRPAGKETPLSTLPMSAAVSPDGKYVLVNSWGAETEKAWLVSPTDGRMIAIGDRFSELVSPGKPFRTKLQVVDEGGRLIGAAPDKWLWSIDYEGEHAEKVCDMKGLIVGKAHVGMSSHCVISPDGKWTWISAADGSLQLERVEWEGAVGKGSER